MENSPRMGDAFGIHCRIGVRAHKHSSSSTAVATNRGIMVANNNMHTRSYRKSACKREREDPPPGIRQLSSCTYNSAYTRIHNQYLYMYTRTNMYTVQYTFQADVFLRAHTSADALAISTVLVATRETRSKRIRAWKEEKKILYVQDTPHRRDTRTFSAMLYSHHIVCTG